MSSELILILFTISGSNYEVNQNFAILNRIVFLMDMFKTAVNLLSAKDGTLLQISEALLIQKSVELGMPLKGQDLARLVNSLHVAYTTRSHAHPPIREA